MGLEGGGCRLGVGGLQWGLGRKAVYLYFEHKSRDGALDYIGSVETIETVDSKHATLSANESA